MADSRASLFTKRGWQWYELYYIMALAAAVGFATSVPAFWNVRSESSTRPEDDTTRTKNEETQPEKSPTIQALQNPSTWFISTFIFVYVGPQVTIGGWRQTFLIDLRHSSSFATGIVNTFYWAGLTGGRVALGFLTPCLKHNNQRFMVPAYLVACIAMQLLFCTADNLVMSAAAGSAHRADQDPPETPTCCGCGCWFR